MRTVQIDDELAAFYDGPKPLEEALREAVVMHLFGARRIDMGKGCELLGVDEEAFRRCATEHNVPIDPTADRA
jgi:uncharacterized protein UPF0175